MKMDRVVVLEKGAIVEQGSHKQLLKKETGHVQKAVGSAGGRIYKVISKLSLTKNPTTRSGFILELIPHYHAQRGGGGVMRSEGASISCQAFCGNLSARQRALFLCSVVPDDVHVG